MFWHRNNYRSLLDYFSCEYHGGIASVLQLLHKPTLHQLTVLQFCYNTVTNCVYVVMNHITYE